MKFKSDNHVLHKSNNSFEAKLQSKVVWGGVLLYLLHNEPTRVDKLQLKEMEAKRKWKSNLFKIRN